jgi:hypothetical protein
MLWSVGGAIGEKPYFNTRMALSSSSLHTFLAFTSAQDYFCALIVVARNSIISIFKIKFECTIKTKS